MRTLLVVIALSATACTPGAVASPSSSTGSQTTVAAPAASERHTFFTHCGFYETEFDGVIWTPASIRRGTSPVGTGFNSTEGDLTRHGDMALFESDTGLAIWFKPAPPDLPPPPPCD